MGTKVIIGILVLVFVSGVVAIARVAAWGPAVPRDAFAEPALVLPPLPEVALDSAPVARSLFPASVVGPVPAPAAAWRLTGLTQGLPPHAVLAGPAGSLVVATGDTVDGRRVQLAGRMTVLLVGARDTLRLELSEGHP